MGVSHVKINLTKLLHSLLSSLRLTAYVAKVFAMASSLVAVEKDDVCGAVKFLILNAQQPDGLFTEVGKVYDAKMTVRAMI